MGSRPCPSSFHLTSRTFLSLLSLLSRTLPHAAMAYANGCHFLDLQAFTELARYVVSFCSLSSALALVFSSYPLRRPPTEVHWRGRLRDTAILATTDRARLHHLRAPAVSFHCTCLGTRYSTVPLAPSRVGRSKYCFVFVCATNTDWLID